MAPAHGNEASSEGNTAAAASDELQSPKMINDLLADNTTKFSILRNIDQHDDDFSVDSNYEEPSDNSLNVWQGAALLTADCLGTGILALPGDIQVLGRVLGISFLVLNLPINYFAGSILSQAANFVERRQHVENLASKGEISIDAEGDDLSTDDRPSQEKGEEEFQDEPPATSDAPDNTTISSSKRAQKDYKTLQRTESPITGDTNNQDGPTAPRTASQQLHHDTATYDFIGMTSALFHSKQATRWVMLLFYTNIFLVLGNYILVMSHAVAALIGEDRICLPTAGALASVLMFGVAQLRTMSKLGRSASIISLLALFIVIGQCVYAVQYPNEEDGVLHESPVETIEEDAFSIFRKLSAMGSIGFAVGSQKLFLNIRHEFKDREAAPKSLGISLSSFGTAYVAIVLCVGKNPPGFLFDAIPQSTSRRWAGLFLWIHVVVSYAINSQAICASVDRLYVSKMKALEWASDRQRWVILSGGMAVSAFFVANAIPFFKDLVALIGALTSVPLTLLLPAIFHRRVLRVPLWCPTTKTIASYSLVVFATLFMVGALVGSVSSIGLDWKNHEGGFFSCSG